jgi:hypothetical protein
MLRLLRCSRCRPTRGKRTFCSRDEPTAAEIYLDANVTAPMIAGAAKALRMGERTIETNNQSVFREAVSVVERRHGTEKFWMLTPRERSTAIYDEMRRIDSRNGLPIERAPAAYFAATDDGCVVGPAVSPAAFGASGAGKNSKSRPTDLPAKRKTAPVKGRPCVGRGRPP